MFPPRPLRPIRRRSLSRLLAPLRFLIPSSCALWGLNARKTLCEGCRCQFFTATGMHCPICAMPFPGTPAAGQALCCGDCQHAHPAFDATIAAAGYAAPLNQLVLALKFGGKLALGPRFARLLADALPERMQPMLLTAIPLSAERLQARGFNQSLEIARPLARLAGMTLAPQLLL